MRGRCLLGLLLVAAACGRDQPVAPTATTPLETARLQFVCGWEPRPPALARLVVDVRVNSAEGPSTPTAADVAAIEAAGGRVLRRFNVAVVRAVLDTAAVRRLVAGPKAVAQYATAVVDTADLRVDTQIFYTRMTTDADVAALAQLGAESLAPLSFRGVIYATLPDGAVPAVSRLPGVNFVQARAVGCAVAASAAVPPGPRR